MYDYVIIIEKKEQKKQRKMAKYKLRNEIEEVL